MFVPLRTLCRMPLSTSLWSWFDTAWGFIPTVSASAVTDRPGRFTKACKRRKRVALASTLNVRSSPSDCASEINGRRASRDFGRHSLREAILVLMPVDPDQCARYVYITQHRVIQAQRVASMTNANESGCCSRQPRAAKSETSPALVILAERFARGEIDKAEFEEKRQSIAGLREEIAHATGNKC